MAKRVPWEVRQVVQWQTWAVSGRVVGIWMVFVQQRQVAWRGTWLDILGEI